jgi:ABC-type glycerol-3-phosphate transport system substrate-binding protein
MKQWKLGLIASVAMAVTVTGCSSGAAPKQAAESKPAEKQAPKAPTTVQFMHSVSGPKGDVVKSLVEEYNKSQSSYVVNATFVPQAERLQKITAEIAGGHPPDLYTAGPPDLMALISFKAVASLDDLAKNAKVKLTKDMFLPKLSGLIAKDGVLRAVPVETSATGLYYNADAFKTAGISAPPANWDQLVDTAKKLTDPAKGKWGILLPTTMEQYTGQIWASFLAEAGGQLLSADEKKAAFNSPEGVRALQFWVDLVNKYKVAPLQQLNNNQITQMFGTGNVGMMIAHPAWIEQSKSFPFQTATAKQPADKQGGSTLGGWYIAILDKASNKEGAYDFLSWLMKPENNVKWNVGMGSLPTQQAVIDTKQYQDYVKATPLVKAFNEALKTDVWTPPATGQFSAIVVTLSKAINEAIYQKSTPKEALDKAAAEVDKLLAKGS